MIHYTISPWPKQKKCDFSGGKETNRQAFREKDGQTDQWMDIQTLILRCEDAFNQVRYTDSTVGFRWAGAIFEVTNWSEVVRPKTT